MEQANLLENLETYKIEENPLQHDKAAIDSGFMILKTSNLIDDPNKNINNNNNNSNNNNNNNSQI